MKTFGNRITLIHNGRGCDILDTVKGCSVCGTTKPNGCYGDCYAMRIASRYGIDFSNPVSRCFDNDSRQLSFWGFADNLHKQEIIHAIRNSKMPFVRIGDMGDPSENWQHTINVCKEVSIAGKPIVIITKHWKPIPDTMLTDISSMDLYINTSISAMDSDTELKYRLSQYERLKKYCKSILRVVSCDFNTNNAEGMLRSKIQDMLFQNKNYIDTVFRPSKNNKYITDGVINVSKVRFLKSTVLASMYNKNTYLGMCDTCPDMCGLTRS